MGALVVLSAVPAEAQLTQGQPFGLAGGGHAYRNNVAFDTVNQVYLVIVQRPPVTARFYNRNGAQIGQDIVVSTEGGYNAWASVAFGGPANDPVFLVTYVASQGSNPKYGRLVRFNAGAPSVSAPSYIVDVGSEWTYAEKAQNVWTGSRFIVGSRVKNAGASFPTFQVNHFDLNGVVSGGVDLGDGADYYGSPAIACVPNSTCVTVGYMAGVPTNYSGGSYGRLFSGSTLAPQGSLFFLSSGMANEDQGVVYQAHLGRFLAEWYRGGGAGFIDTRIIATDGSMSALDLTKGIGPGAGSNSAAYNAGTRTTLLLTKGPAAELMAVELGDDGYPLNSSGGIVLTTWDGVVVDYLPSVGANSIHGQWLVTWELNSGGFANILSSAASTCAYTLNPSSSGTLPAGGASGTVSMTTSANCPWSATTNQSWIHTPSSGTGNGTIAYTVDPNPGAARTGSITAGGRTFSISQAAFVASQRAQLTSPVTGSTLTSSTVSFQWTSGVGVTQYWLYVGTTVGGFDLANYNMGTQLGVSVPNLPASGQTIYVRLNSLINGVWQFNDYTFTAATLALTKAQLISPAPSSTLNDATVLFEWTGGVNATQYWLSIGSSAVTADLVSRDLGQTLRTVVAGLPADGRTLYVTLHTLIGGTWYFSNYTLTATTLIQRKAELVSPAPGSTLNSSNVAFRWTGGVGSTQYWLYVGTAPGGFDLANRNMGTQLSTVVLGLPTAGQTIYVRVHSLINGAWLFNDYSFTATAQGPAMAQLINPAPSSTLSSSTVSFEWTGGVGVLQYWLSIGSAPATADLVSRDLGQSLSTVVAGLPVDGRKLYVRLHANVNGTWQFTDYLITAAPVAPATAELVSPAPGSTLTNATVTLQWTGGVGVTQYWLSIGSAPATADLVSRDLRQSLSTVVSGLPTDGRTIYVRLHSNVSGIWQFNDYSYTSTSATQQKAQLVSPAAGSTLTSSTVTFRWTGGTGPTQYWLYVGTAPGGFDLANYDMGTELSAVVPGLPSSGQPIYVRLHSLMNGAWQFTDYTLTATTPLGTKAELVSPAAGSTLNSSTVTFRWTGGVGVTQYWLYVGMSQGGFDLANYNMGTQLSAVVPGLPTHGQTIYVRLYSLVNGAWQFSDYTLAAVGLDEESETGEEAVGLSTAAPDTLVHAASDESPFDLWPVAVASREGSSLSFRLQ